MSFLPKLQISSQFAFNEAEDFCNALRIEALSCHIFNTVTKCRKLKQEENSCFQNIEGVWKRINSISFVPNSVPNRRQIAEYLLPTLLLFAACGKVHCHSNIMPQNVAQRIGERVVMSCAFDGANNSCQDMVWTHYTAQSLAANIIWMGDKMSPLFSDYISIVDLNDGTCTLEIKTQPSVEGRYECLSATTGNIASASLIILADYPECLVKSVVNETGEYSNITCWVEYFGDWAPTMEWIAINEQKSASINLSQSYTSDQMVRANLVVPRNIFSGYQCIIKFTEQGRKTKTTATNVPHYEWPSIIFDTTWEIQTEVESTTERANEVSVSVNDFHLIGLIIGYICTFVSLIVITIMFLKNRRIRSHEMRTKLQPEEQAL